MCLLYHCFSLSFPLPLSPKTGGRNILGRRFKKRKKKREGAFRSLPAQELSDSPPHHPLSLLRPPPSLTGPWSHWAASDTLLGVRLDPTTFSFPGVSVAVTLARGHTRRAVLPGTTCPVSAPEPPSQRCPHRHPLQEDGAHHGNPKTPGRKVGPRAALRSTERLRVALCEARNRETERRREIPPSPA